MSLKIVGVVTLLLVLSIGTLFAYYRKDLDQIRPSELAKRVQTTVTRYYDRNDKLLWEDKGNGDYTIKIEDKDIPDYLRNATIAIEDKDFYNHGGVSVTGLARAALNNTQSDNVQGGSTLTQQLVKQVFFADEAQKRGLDGIPRKIKEVILSIEVERMYNKQQILNLYLNESPYGGRRNGVESAARTYFDKSAKKLDLAESALLAAIPNEPGKLNPYNKAGNGDLVLRQQRVLNNMVGEKFITQAEADAAKKIDILDRIKPEADQYKGIKAPHFVQMVRSELEKKLGKATVGRGGLIVKTTLDMKIQSNMESEMKKMFSSGVPEYAGFSNGAAAIEDVRTGQIVGLVGSRDFRYPGFGQDNSATAFLQPGSSIKPLVYAELFRDKGNGKVNFGSGSILSDVKTNFPGFAKPPQNATGDFKGNINIRRSLALSRNIPAFKAMSVAGVPQTLKTIRAMGDKNYCTQGGEKASAGLASAIGGCGTKMTDHVNALASLARMGVNKPQTSILKVTNSSGQVLDKYKNEQKKIIDPQAAYIVNDILGDNNARAPLYGRSITPNSDAAGIKVATKTGTSNTEINGVISSKDIWTVSYTPSLSVAVWFGNPEPKAMPHGLSAYASDVADPIITYATKYYQKEKLAKAGEWFKRPSGIQQIGGELYPSYYNRQNGLTNAKLTFDRVSKKKATKCTPDGARIEVAVRKTKDPFSKKDIIIAPDGYDATADDDRHECDDRKPSVSLVTTDELITIQASKGTFSLDSMDVAVNGRTVASPNVSKGGLYKVPYTFTKAATVTVTITDSGYYEGTASRKHTPTPTPTP